jgi:hypothetical protein
VRDSALIFVPVRYQQSSLTSERTTEISLEEARSHELLKGMIPQDEHAHR